jgi:hypothetical protein
MLLITVDCDDVLACREYGQVTRIAEAICAARPDVFSMDVADNDSCHYPSVAGTTSSGHPMDVLLAAGHDPYGIIMKSLKEAGIAVVPNYRVNDHHGAPAMWTAWEREHKAWSLGKDTGVWQTFKAVGDRGWREIGDLRQMDYAIEGVRKRRLAILSEVVARYPVDGLQLDFGRSAPYLSHPKREQAKYLTQFVREVRAMLEVVGQQRGQQLLLSAAVPWDLAFCTQEGLDIKQWIDEGLLSYVCPGEWFYVDYNIPYSEWTALTKGSGCKVYPMLMSNVSPTTAVTAGKRVWLGDDYQEFDPPKIRALAESAYSQGADGIMFYNLFVRDSGKTSYPFLRDWIEPAKLSAMPRHYFYARRLKYLPTEHYSFGLPDGYAPGEEEAFTPFPLDKVGDQVTYHFLFGSKLGTAKAAFQFKLRDLGDADGVVVSLNGQGIVPDAVSFRPCQLPDAPAFRFARWQAALGSPPLNLGDNVLTVKLVKRDPGRYLPIQVGEFEVLVDATDR